MRQIRIEKVTLNFGAGKDQARLEKGVKLIKHVAGIQPVKTFARKRIQEWGLRPGLPIGCKVTLRKQNASEMLKRLLEAKENNLHETNFDKEGNISFGIPEYIDIPNAKYDPDIGIMGFQVCVTLRRNGFRIKQRSLRKRAVPHKHRIARDEAIKFMQDTFNMKIGE